jgi:nickel transport protein
MSRVFSPPLRAVLCGLIVCWIGQALPAQAHGMRLVAWVEGDRVCSESSFGKTTKVRDGMAVARDTAGALLAEGKTDEAGVWCFPSPVPQDVVIAVNAGQGHRAEFLLSAKAFAEASPPDRPADLPQNLDDQADLDNPDELHDLVREAVREELQAQLAPIRRALAERDAAGPTWRDILGGLGWIIGLAGLAAWGASRRKT